MSPSRRPILAFTGATLCAVALVALGMAVWRAKLIPWVEGRLAHALGHRVSVGSLSLRGPRTLIARQVRIWGAPPFDSEPTVRAERVTVRLGGAGRGFWEPAQVLAEGVDVEYLGTLSGDNVRGPATAQTAKLGHRATVHGPGPSLEIRGVRVHGTFLLPGNLRVAFRAADGFFRRGSDDTEVSSLSNLTIDLGPQATVRVPRIDIQARHGALVAARGERADLIMPGGGALLHDLSASVGLSGRDIVVDLRATAHAGHPLFHLSGRWSHDLADLEIEAQQVPLRALAPLAGPRGVAVEDAHADLHAVASVDLERQRAPFDIDARIADIDITHPSVDRTPWRALSGHIHLTGQAALDSRRVEIESGELSTFGLTLGLKGWADLSPAPRGEISVASSPDMPMPCDSLLAAQPEPVRKTLAGLSLTGKLGIAAELSFDAAAWETLTMDVRVAPRCQVKAEPRLLADLLPALLRGDATEPAARSLPLGKYHPDFAPLSAMPKHLPGAFLTSEDGRFYSHDGFDPEMIRHALAQDLETGSFGRGASTITQQLAKNLFLHPYRTLARKLEETVLAWRLHNLLPKDRILELYLNVIELGPGIRGVRQAAHTYFDKDLAQLKPIESAHLAALTPNPHALARRFRDGRLDDGWLQRLHDLLAMMKRSGRLSAAELSAARGHRPGLRPLPATGNRPSL